MQPLSPSPQRFPPPPRFGSAGGGSGLTGMTKAVDGLFRSFQSNRGAEMLVEDVVGFGLLRTGMDLRRNKMYGDDSLNVPAAAERFAREILSILTDCVLGGVVAWGVGKAVFDRKNQAFSSQFIQYPSLELFQDIAKSSKLEGVTCPNEAQAAFREALAERIVLKDGKALPDKALQALNAVWNQKPTRDVINDKAKVLVQAVNQQAEDFNLSLRVNTPKGSQTVQFAANELLDDVSRFSCSMAEAWKNKGTQGTAWQAMAKKAIGRTLIAKNWTIPIGLAAGMTATFASSFLLNGLTKKFSGIDYFPGETSLRKQQPNRALNHSPKEKGFWEKHFPYVGEALKNGNPLPLVGALVPLLAAVGAFDTYNRRFINPIKGLKEGTLKKLFDFSKKAPFTSQQQMAAMFALLITSRLLSSRSDNEYKERILDSAVGWGAWIIGTPLIKKGVSKLLDRKLLTQAGALKSREAVEAFSKQALAKNVWVGIGSTLGTIGILGLLAPWAGIKWTQWNEKRKQQNATLGQSPQAQPQAQPMPALGSVAPKPFAPTPTIANPFSPGMARPMTPPAGNAFLNVPPNYAWPQR
ncbi:hypothetical protein [Vampirovibrio chlorellavorus]|uniref:hypothetical protein n=1 Tax=Vampirovibrio chlorellavorus TaxID=758823 RepID=UPI0026EA651F|nr:hypothetical protein [Vampirovibrio chlorellavorus]